VKQSTKRNHSQQGKASRRKGQVGERAIAKILTERGFEAKRGVQFKGGVGSPDVICAELPFHFEVKHVEKLNLRAAYAQSKKDSGGLKYPVVLHKKNRQRWLATIDLFDFINMLQVVMNKVDHLNTMEGFIDEFQRIREERTRNDRGCNSVDERGEEGSSFDQEQVQPEDSDLL